MSDPHRLLVCGDALRIPLPDQSVHAVVTSPPYLGLRDYGIAPTTWGGDPACEHDWKTVVRPAANGIINSAMQGATLSSESATRQPTFSDSCARCGAWRGVLGLEPSAALYVRHMKMVAMEINRVLRPDGTVWLVIGDSYAGSGGAGGDYNAGGLRAGQPRYEGTLRQLARGKRIPRGSGRWGFGNNAGPKRKDLIGVPWMLAFALRSMGWWLRAEIIWDKPNPMTDSAADRPARSHEQVFLFSKSEHYFYDDLGARMPTVNDRLPGRGRTIGRDRLHNASHAGIPALLDSYHEQGLPATRGLRTVWTIPTQAYKGAHYATFPVRLVTPCVLASTSAGGTCPNCGDPWVRVIDRIKNPLRDMEKQRQTARRTGRTDGYVPGPEGKVDKVRTLGWRPSCDCYDPVYQAMSVRTGNAHKRQQQDAQDGWWPRLRRQPLTGERLADFPALLPAPAIVLDPFCGSGTVGEVCRSTGRSFVGVDRSWKYLTEQARLRVNREVSEEKLIENLPLFAKVD